MSRRAVRAMSRLISEHQVTEGGCWEWTGPSTRNGYGRCALHGVTQLTHRVAWLLLRGPIPDGLQLDHLCRNTLCFNPDHLEPVTGAENSRRASLAQRRCVNGHEFTEANTYWTRAGHRSCRTCNREAQARSGARKSGLNVPYRR